MFASHQYFTSHWIGSFLTFSEICNVALVCKDASRVANLALQQKVHRWSCFAALHTLERKCIARFRSSVCVPPLLSPALYSLQLRFLRRREYHLVVQRDPRLTREHKAALHAEGLCAASPQQTSAGRFAPQWRSAGTSGSRHASAPPSCRLPVSDGKLAALQMRLALVEAKERTSRVQLEIEQACVIQQQKWHEANLPALPLCSCAPA